MADSDNADDNWSLSNNTDPEAFPDDIEMQDATGSPTPLSPLHQRDAPGSLMIGPSPAPVLQGPQSTISQQGLAVGEDYDEIDDSKYSGVYLCKSVDPLYKVYRWKIERFSQQTALKIFSDKFEVGGFPWRLMMFPRGNGSPSLSAYLEVADAAEQKGVWSRRAKFLIGVIHPDDYRRSKHMEASKLFLPEETDWGFRELIGFEELKKGGFIRNDTLVVETTVEVEPVRTPSSTAVVLADKNGSTPVQVSEEPRYVGLKNQGATCYMNSLLQTLFHLPDFRRAVYRMPTLKEDNPEKSVALALQRVFYQLQYAKHAVGTKQLTKSFGWDAVDSFMQHDVQELARVLLDNLETKMKGTSVEGTIERLFRGRMKNFIRCVNVDFTSTRSEEYYDVQLNVKDCKAIADSFKQYVDIEKLDGDNKYHAEGHGLQDAEKGVVFETFPQVLMLQLKRFNYDFVNDRMYKINDRLEFPQTLDLTPFQVQPDNQCLYELHSVLVHAGDVHGGHYYAFVRPTLDSQWYKFDDDHVIASPASEAMDENFGGTDRDRSTGLGGMAKTRRFQNNPFRRFANAYMLVYVRKSDEPTIMAPVTADEIPDHLKEWFDRELREEEARRVEKSEAHLYVSMNVVTRADLQAQAKLDLVDKLASIEPVRVRRDATFSEFKELVSKRFSIPVENQRYWKFETRQNETFRPDVEIIAEDKRSVEKVFKVQSSSYASYVGSEQRFLFVECVENCAPLSRDHIMLYFKHYDPSRNEITFVQEYAVKASSLVGSLRSKVREFMNWPEDTEVLLFEEMRIDRIEELTDSKTIVEAELQSGDIIVFQKAVTESEEYLIPTADKYLVFLANRVNVKFLPLSEPDATPFELELSLKMTHDEVAEVLGRAIGKPGSHLRFTGYSSYSNRPKMEPLKSECGTLRDMLHAGAVAASDRLFFEVLEIPLRILETKKVVNFHFLRPDSFALVECRVYVPKTATVKDVFAEAPLQNEVMQDCKRPLKLLQLTSGRISRLFRDEDRVDLLYDFATILYIMQEEPADSSPDDEHAVVYVCHGERNRNSVKFHGVPFMFVVDKSTTAKDLLTHVGHRLPAPEEEVAKWNVVMQTSSNAMDLLAPEDSILEAIERVPRGFTYVLFVERKDTDQKKPQVVSTRHYERDIKIYN
eukprot:ANDGO_06901.mRNA.1 Ubiquitin carboxyl-terminal hydrolase 12